MLQLTLMLRAHFLIPVLCITLLLGACAPAAPTQAPTPSPAPSATPSPVPATPTTALPTAVPTPTAEPRYLGALDAEQQAALDAAARAYISLTPAEAIVTARELDYLGRNANPATMCGPLSIAILRDAGLLYTTVNLYDFWYLDPRPRQDENLLEQVFPAERYEKIEQPLSIGEVDFNANPLYPGDFLYLFAGDSGSFEHVLVVSRVDDAGRAYAVTNVNTTEGVIIDEVMLYDPAQPGVGQFYEWTDWENRMIGRTGYGGYWLWRLKEPLPLSSEANLLIGAKIDKIIENIGGDWNILIKEVNGKVFYSHNAYEKLHPASVIKLADAILFLKILEEKEEDLYQYLSTYGTDSRSFAQLLKAMVVNSEEEAANSIERYTAEFINSNSMLREMGFPNTSINPRQSTAEEMSRMMEMLYTGSLLKPDTSAYLLSLLAEYTPSDLTRTGVIREFLADKDRIFNKRGSLSKDITIVADLACIELGDRAFIIAIFGYNGNDPPAGYDELEIGIKKITLTFWQFLNEN